MCTKKSRSFDYFEIINYFHAFTSCFILFFEIVLFKTIFPIFFEVKRIDESQNRYSLRFSGNVRQERNEQGLHAVSRKGGTPGRRIRGRHDGFDDLDPSPI